MTYREPSSGAGCGKSGGMGDRAVKQTGTNLIGKGKAGPGRPKGVPNRNTAIIKDMIVQALDEAGGVEYLTRQARENPGPFMTLLGKVLPMQVTGADGGPIEVTRIELVPGGPE